MKRLDNRLNRTITILFMMVMSIAAMTARDKMAIDPIFGNAAAYQCQVEDIKVTGSDAEKYNLSLFHSLKLDNCPQDLADRVEQAVNRDAADPVQKTVYLSDRRMRYAFYKLHPEHGENRYLFFMRKPLSDGSCFVILIYMAGPATTEQVKKMINL